MADQEQLSVQIDLNTLRGATHEQKVPVSLFVLCKAIVEDEGGALFLDATVVQRVQVGNVPVPDTLDPTSEKSTAEHLKALMFDIGLKGPFPGGEVKIRRDATLTGVGAQPDSTKLCAQTSNLVSVPIDVRSIWHWFPFRILQGTVELELQAKSTSFVEGKKVFLCPTLCVSSPKQHRENVVKAKPMGQINRSRTLALLQPTPTIEILEDARWKKGAKEKRANDPRLGNDPTPDPDDLFITFPLMRLTFWLHEPTSKAVFKVLGPLLLVVTLMWVNFHEFYGIFDIWDGCPEQDRDSEYLANGIGIAIAAFFMIPLIRAESRNSYHGSFTRDDYVALAFLVGLGVSTLRNCFAAFIGCLISSIVVVGAMGSLVAHHFECDKIKGNNADYPIQVQVNSEEQRKKKVKTSAQEFTASHWCNAAKIEGLPTSSGVKRRVMGGGIKGR
ncbi:unnamed protein product [Ascophyllum nodosum]